jgi:hypothetical protein
MKKTARKWLLRLSAALLIIALAAVFLLTPVPIIIIGSFRGEAFYEGRPTSYWRQVIREQRQGPTPPTPSFFDKVRAYFGFPPPRPEHMRGASRGAAVPVLRHLLNDRDPEVRRFAADTLLSGGNLLEEILDQALGDLQNTDPQTRQSAARRLRYFGKQARKAVPHFIESVKRNPQDSYYLLGVLEEIGPDARSAVPALSELMDTSTGLYRLYVARLLGLLDLENPAVEAVFVAALRKGRFRPEFHDPFVSGPGARDGCEALILLLREPRLPNAAAIIRKCLQEADDMSATDRWDLEQALKLIEAEAAKLGTK